MQKSLTVAPSRRAKPTIHTSLNAVVLALAVLLGFFSLGPVSIASAVPTDGTLDTSFSPTGTGPNDDVEWMQIQPDGKIVISGSFSSFNGTTVGYITRLNTDGTLDTSFNPGGTGAGSRVRMFAVQTGGEILIAGHFSSYNGTTGIGRIARLNTDGTLDTSFNPSGAGANNTIASVAVLPSGKILIGGSFTSYNGTTGINRIARLNADGTLDTSFNPSGAGANGNITSIKLQPDGKILIAGGFTDYNGTTVGYITRLNADGTRDTSFNPGGTGTGNPVDSIGLQSDGKILIGGTFLNYNGTTAYRIIRLNADGTRDTSFNPGGTDPGAGVMSIVVQPDAKILIGGWFLTYNGVTVNHVARLNADGTLDTSFNGGGSRANTVIRAIAQQIDGTIYIGGDFTSYDGISISRVARLGTASNNGGGGSGGGSSSSSLADTGAESLVSTGVLAAVAVLGGALLLLRRKAQH